MSFETLDRRDARHRGLNGAVRNGTSPRVQGHAPAPAPLVRPQCSLTVDVEDWYQSSVDYDAPITDRVVRNTDRVLEILNDCGAKGTFFVQGLVAEKFPGLVRRLVALGHEVQSHGHTHRPLHGMDRRALRAELDTSRKAIEDAAGVRVTAFRAPDFSILSSNLWALEVLSECGYEVDSSIFPMATKRYGISEWPLTPSRVRLPNGAQILEVPVAVWRRGRLRFPVAGGGYFRLLPEPLVGRALRGILAEQRPAVLYCHPYEFNPGEPSEYRHSVPLSFRLHQGLGRSWFGGRIRRLLSTLPFGRLDEVLASWEHPR